MCLIEREWVSEWEKERLSLISSQFFDYLPSEFATWQSCSMMSFVLAPKISCSSDMFSKSYEQRESESELERVREREREVVFNLFKNTFSFEPVSSISHVDESSYLFGSLLLCFACEKMKLSQPNLSLHFFFHTSNQNKQQKH